MTVTGEIKGPTLVLKFSEEEGTNYCTLVLYSDRAFKSVFHNKKLKAGEKLDSVLVMHRRNRRAST